MGNTKRFKPEEYKDILEQNSARQANGLPLLKIRVRTCMVCGAQFESVSRRICCDPSVPYLLEAYSINEYK